MLYIDVSASLGTQRFDVVSCDFISRKNKEANNCNSYYFSPPICIIFSLSDGRNFIFPVAYWQSVQTQGAAAICCGCQASANNTAHKRNWWETSKRKRVCKFCLLKTIIAKTVTRAFKNIPINYFTYTWVMQFAFSLTGLKILEYIQPFISDNIFI